MEPITTVTGVLTLAKSAAEISKLLDQVWKSTKNRKLKQQIEDALDRLHELKQSAAAVEDENRELREKLRFKRDDYEFRTPFHYSKARPSQPLCPKCFARGREGPMGEPGLDCTLSFRKCLVCNNNVQIQPLIGIFP